MFFFKALSALSFSCIPIWLGIQVSMMMIFLERAFILHSSVNHGLLCFGDSFIGYGNEGVGKMYYGFFLICI